MDLKKLKIDGFNTFIVENFPEQYNPGLETILGDEIDVILYYINVIDDVEKFVNICETTNLSLDNRVIFVYEKGRKDGVNRDTIFKPFKDGLYKGYKMKAPMMCSLSPKLSAFAQQKVNC